MPGITKEQFLNEYAHALNDGNAALFLGAGMSAASGMVDWRELLRDVARGLGLDVDEESDLIALAQYEYNNSGTRYRLNNAIINKFAQRATLSPNHKWMAQLPIEVAWTTNYDRLVERAFESLDRRVDVKWSPEQLTSRLRNADVTIYKMHGDLVDPDHAVLTKDDYERYEVEREAFTELLRTDLTRYCFLFLGFSFTDPNIEYILSRLRRMLNGAQRIHYCIMRRPEKASNASDVARYNRDLARFRHRVADLKRFGIQTVVIDEYAEIEPLLKALVRRSGLKNVFVSGSSHEFEPLGRERLERLAYRIGKELILRGYNLVSGFGLGVGGACILGAHEACYFDKKVKTGQHLLLRVFPQDLPPQTNQAELYTRIRTEMIENSGVLIFLSGNKLDPESGTVTIADGVLEEFQLARSQAKYVIPVPCTGHAAQMIWQEMTSELNSIFPNIDVEAEFHVLGDKRSNENQIVEAIFAILEKLQ